ncbi:MAG TPA: hypothetical protein VFX01_07675, partial [Methylophilaceae bacterium]|nr:hypothetical protein [Methylophilaceae bacterium]
MKLLHSLAAGVLMISSGLALAAEFNGDCVTTLSKEGVHKTDCSIKTEYKGKEYCFGSEASKAA